MSHLEELRQDRRVTDDDVLRARIAVLDNHIRLLSQKRRVEVHVTKAGEGEPARESSSRLELTAAKLRTETYKLEAQLTKDQADFERAAKEMIRTFEAEGKELIEKRAATTADAEKAKADDVERRIPSCSTRTASSPRRRARAPRRPPRR